MPTKRKPPPPVARVAWLLLSKGSPGSRGRPNARQTRGHSITMLPQVSEAVADGNGPALRRRLVIASRQSYFGTAGARRPARASSETRRQGRLCCPRLRGGFRMKVPGYDPASQPEGVCTMDNQPLTIGQPAPEFEVMEGAKNRVKLSALRGKKVVLLFSPMDFSPTCTTELCPFGPALPRLQGGSADTVVFGVSC